MTDIIEEIERLKRVIVSGKINLQSDKIQILQALEHDKRHNDLEIQNSQLLSKVMILQQENQSLRELKQRIEKTIKHLDEDIKMYSGKREDLVTQRKWAKVIIQQLLKQEKQK